MHKPFPVALVVLACLPLSAHAQWSGKGSAGLVIARGNTTTNTANASIDVVREIENWKNQFALAGIYASDSVGATAQRWNAETQTDWKFSDTGFWFGKLRYERDRFSGFEFQGTASTGLGHKFFDTDATKLSAQAGVGYRVSHVLQATEDDGVTIIPPYYERETIFSGALDFRRSLSDSASLLDKYIIESGTSNTFMQNDLQLQLKVKNALAVALGLQVKHNSSPSPGFKKTDTLTTVNLVYEFKGAQKSP